MGDVTKQTEIDKLMVEIIDGTQNDWGWSKSSLGANAVLAVSMAICRAGAASMQIPLYEYIAYLSGRPTDKFVMPVPCLNVINGGTHAGNRLAVQEFMILPVGASSFREAMNIGAEVYHTLKGVLLKKYGQDACNVGDEGGFAPPGLAMFLMSCRICLAAASAAASSLLIFLSSLSAAS